MKGPVAVEACGLGPGMARHAESKEQTISVMLLRRTFVLEGNMCVVEADAEDETGTPRSLDELATGAEVDGPYASWADEPCASLLLSEGMSISGAKRRGRCACSKHVAMAALPKRRT